MRFQNSKRFAVITTFRSRFSVKKVSGVMTLFIIRTVGIRLLCKREPSVLFYNTSGFIISVYNLTLWFATFSMYLRFRYPGKNPMRFARFFFWRILHEFEIGIKRFLPKTFSMSLVPRLFFYLWIIDWFSDLSNFTSTLLVTPVNSVLSFTHACVTWNWTTMHYSVAKSWLRRKRKKCKSESNFNSCKTSFTESIFDSFF